MVCVTFFSAQLKWELGSSVLGLLLRKYAPHDVYEASSPQTPELWYILAAYVISSDGCPKAHCSKT